MDMFEEEIRYFCEPFSNGRIMVVAVGTLDDVYNFDRKLPHWTFAFTKEYLDSFSSDRIVWFQQEFNFD